MSGQDDTPDKETMRRFWRSRGKAWDRWADVVAENAARMDEPLIEAARLKPGLRLLDLASGAGQPALPIAARLAPDGEVVASDLLPEMLQGAKRRAEAAGLANIRFEIADMEALPFASASFDRVTCRFGIMFVPGTAKALAETARVLKPGGRAAFMVWGPRENTTMFRVIAEAADRILGADPEQDMAAIFRFAAPGSLAGEFTGAGFVNVEESELRLDGTAPLGTPFWRPQLEMSIGPRLEKAEAAQRKALEAAVADGFAREISEGRYRLAAHARIVAGDKPAR
jgi:ubiquinone/menaquinone biosynthesis C-methylase UbiE